MVTNGIKLANEKKAHRMTKYKMDQLKIAKGRSDLLLLQAHKLLQKQDVSFYVINVLSEKLKYDGTTCDGYCLKEDIETHLELEE